jgi:hypothetical protein
MKADHALQTASSHMSVPFATKIIPDQHMKSPMREPISAKNNHTGDIIQPSHPRIRNKIQLPTSIKVKQLAHYLEGYEKSKIDYLIDGLNMGFSLEFEGKRSYQYSPNLKSALKNPEIVSGISCR